MNELNQLSDVASLKLTAPLPLSNHPAAVYLSGLGERSRPTMRQSLDAIASMLTNNECDALTLDWSKVRYRHTAMVRAALKERLSPATVRKMLCALKGVLHEAFRLDLITAQEYAKAVDWPRLNVPSPPLKGRALSEAEIAALMSVCSSDRRRLQGVRDLALIAILRGGGLRRNEVVNLEVKDFHPDTNLIEVRHGKRGEYRKVYLATAAVELVQDWLLERGSTPGPLICPVRGGNVKLRSLTSDAVLKILKRRGEQAGIESFSTHDFRRTFCSDLLDAGVDIVTVQKLAGHSSSDITAKYDRRGEETKRQAVESLSIPIPPNRLPKPEP